MKLLVNVMDVLTPLVFLACGAYGGIVYGGIVGAVRATSRTPQPVYQLATIRRPQIP
jgi:hypothetical protein